MHVLWRRNDVSADSPNRSDTATLLKLVEEVCSCGRSHPPLAIDVLIGKGAIEALPSLARAQAGTAAVALFDLTTHGFLGARVEAALQAHGLDVTAVVLGSPGTPFEPNEAAIAAATDAILSSGAKLVVGVGSGAINDLGKYVAAQQNLCYACVATAPSMDGYTAPISALFLGGVKTTVESKRPDVVAGELDVLAEAPAHLLAAGFGDVLGKLTSLGDWELAKVLFDEYWCEQIASGVHGIATDVRALADELAQRRAPAAAKLMDALVQTGLSVSYVGNSRPTSGSEHLISHFVEMWSLNRHRRPPAHGHVVGVATIIVSEIAAALRQLSADELPSEAPVTGASLEAVLTELKLTDVPSNFGVSKFDRAKRAARLPRIRSAWGRITDVLAKIPPPEQLLDALERVGAPTRFSQLGLDAEVAQLAVRDCRYLRERYTMLDLAADIGAHDALTTRLVGNYR